MKFHPLADIFPIIDGDVHNLAEDIKSHGQTHPIIVHEEKILDGRHRFKACQIAGVEPKFIPFHQNGHTPMQYVISEKINRGHLSDSQRSVAALYLKDIFKKQLLSEGNKPKPNELKTTSSSMAAVIVRVTRSQVDKAGFIRNHSPEFLKDVLEGKLSLNRAWIKTRMKIDPDFDKRVKAWNSNSKNIIIDKESQSLISISTTLSPLDALDRLLSKQLIHSAIVRNGNRYFSVCWKDGQLCPRIEDIISRGKAHSSMHKALFESSKNINFAKP